MNINFYDANINPPKEFAYWSGTPNIPMINDTIIFDEDNNKGTYLVIARCWKGAWSVAIFVTPKNS